MKARLLEWLQIRRKGERREYVRELLRPATKSDILRLVCVACALLALVVTVQNVLRVTVRLIDGASVPWERVGIIQAIAILFYVSYVYLKRSINRDEKKVT